MGTADGENTQEERNVKQIISAVKATRAQTPFKFHRYNKRPDKQMNYVFDKGLPVGKFSVDIADMVLARRGLCLQLQLYDYDSEENTTGSF